MLTSFISHVTLVIYFTLIFNGLSQYYNWRDKREITWRVGLGVSLLFSLLSYSMMINSFVYNGLFFDLRATPIYFISFLLGWRYGLITSLIPLAYRIYLGGDGLLAGVISGIIIPFVIGAIAYKFARSKGIYEIIDIKKMIILNQFYTIGRGWVLWVMLEIPFRIWLVLNICLTIFSVIILVSIGFMFNHFTRKAAAEQQLIDSEERYRRLLQMIPDGVAILHNDEFIYANDHLAHLLGVDNPNELIGKESKLFFSNRSEYEEVVEERIEKVLRGEAVPFLEREIIRHDGERLEVETAVSPYIEKDKKYILGIMRDLSHEKKADIANKLLEETIELDRLKTEFFSNISHELKTPLNIILGTIQLANISTDHDLINHNFDKHMKIMKQNCYRLLRLINNLLDITRIESGFLSLEIRNHDIVGVVEDITLSVARYVEDNKIQLTFDTEVEEKYIACDADKIERIILNLLSNAIKFTNPGGSIDVNIYSQKDHVLISVKDTGIGISEENLSHIFQRFKQVENSYAKNITGSGIGLSLVKSLIEAHGGGISVKSQIKKGSEFLIRLPDTQIENSPTSNEVAATNTSSKVERVTIEFSDIYS